MSDLEKMKKIFESAEVRVDEFDDSEYTILCVTTDDDEEMDLCFDEDGSFKLIRKSS